MKYSTFFVCIVALFVTLLLTANIVAVKLLAFPFGLIAPAGILVFPLSYLFGDVLAEVYGYRTTQRVILLGFACNLVMVAVFLLAGLLPSASFWTLQASYMAILGFTPRLLVASFVAYLVGQHINAFVMVRMKQVTQGKWLWLRAYTSTFLGEGLDTLLFITIAFYGVPSQTLTSLILTQWLLKVGYELLATPLTYAAVSWLRQHEQGA